MKIFLLNYSKLLYLFFQVIILTLLIILGILSLFIWIPIFWNYFQGWKALFAIIYTILFITLFLFSISFIIKAILITLKTRNNINLETEDKKYQLYGIMNTIILFIAIITSFIFFENQS